jgi:hypothetical protein
MAFPQDIAQHGTAAAIAAATIENSVLAAPATDRMWAYAPGIDAGRWDKLFPYQLLVLDVSAGGSGTVTSSYTLPIPPQELSVNTPFAISTQVTLGGIVEQHNGAPLRPISLSGTMGVWPGRGSLPPLTALNLARTVFAGNVGVQMLITGNPRGGQGGVAPEKDFASGSSGVQTGYYQLRLLQQYLEAYAAAKKTDAGRNLRLAFAIWKDQAVYYVTPKSFEYRKSAVSPQEYLYSLQLLAWKRVILGAGGATSSLSGSSVQKSPQTGDVQDGLEAGMTGQQRLLDNPGPGPSGSAVNTTNLFTTGAPPSGSPGGTAVNTTGLFTAHAGPQ